MNAHPPYQPLGEPIAPPKFKVERWADIRFNADEEWLIKGVLPRRGIAAIYGKPKSFKSFLAFHMGLSIALGEPWAARRVERADVIYLAAEGAAGLRKRKAGYMEAWSELPEDVPFSLIAATPNLGTETSDLAELIRTIKTAGRSPGLVVVDTVAKSLGAGDENGTGMTTFLGNAGALATAFDCLILIESITWECQTKPKSGPGAIPALPARLMRRSCANAWKAS